MNSPRTRSARVVFKDAYGVFPREEADSRSHGRIEPEQSQLYDDLVIGPPLKP